MRRLVQEGCERGLTLIEIMVVVALAGVVTLGLAGFYLSSQATWMDASSKTMAQRDATTLMETITRQAREAGAAVVLPASPDSSNSELILYTPGFLELARFTWTPGDSLVHQGLGVNTDVGPVVSSLAERFKVSLDPNYPLIHIDLLQMRGANGQVVTMRSSVKLYNAP